MHDGNKTLMTIVRKGGRAAILMTALGSLALLVAACGGNDDSNATPAGTASTQAAAGLDYAKLRGSVRVDGSSTVFPISEAVAEEFKKVAKGVNVNVAFSGTGGGFEKFCRGEIAISDASRPINDKEKAACNGAGITEIVELQVAIDALTVVVNPANTWAKCLTSAQLQLAFKDGGAKRWKDIDPSWPAENIRFYYPGADSGTFDYFKEANKLRGSASNEPSHRSDGTSSEDDNVLTKGIEGEKYAIGYFGFAYFEEAGKKLKAVEINNGTECVAPSFDNALSGKYKPLSRPLFIYANGATLKQKQEVLGFGQFYLDNTVELSAEVGYVSLPAELLKSQQAKLAPYLPK